eukprot:TRINITY_DN8761_c0_g1_i3.p1 TRINITY_DN8761_c0_g1~~TRINITY_DN8761_c0_g1_i3.p1  ORF type:complete len:385 (+),score=64.85 TRINITY_DN8761_c0_g1_i3:14-1168(+)
MEETIRALTESLGAAEQQSMAREQYETAGSMASSRGHLLGAFAALRSKQDAERSAAASGQYALAQECADAVAELEQKLESLIVAARACLGSQDVPDDLNQPLLAAPPSRTAAAAAFPPPLYEPADDTSQPLIPSPDPLIPNKVAAGTKFDRRAEFNSIKSPFLKVLTDAQARIQEHHGSSELTTALFAWLQDKRTEVEVTAEQAVETVLDSGANEHQWGDFVAQIRERASSEQVLVVRAADRMTRISPKLAGQLGSEWGVNTLFRTVVDTPDQAWDDLIGSPWCQQRQGERAAAATAVAARPLAPRLLAARLAQRHSPPPPPGCPPGGIWKATRYCGPITWCIACFACWCIVCCPVDERNVYIVNGQVYDSDGMYLHPDDQYHH